MQGFTLTAITYVEKTKLRRKKFQSQWTRVLGQGGGLKGMSRKITMEGFRLSAITDVEKTKLRCNC